MPNTRGLWDAFQAAFPVNRVVALLGSLVFAPLAGWLATVLASISITVDQGALVAVFSSVALGVVAIVYKWLDGWQKHEAKPVVPPVAAPLPVVPSEAPPATPSFGGGIEGV